MDWREQCAVGGYSALFFVSNKRHISSFSDSQVKTVERTDRRAYIQRGRGIKGKNERAIMMAEYCLEINKRSTVRNSVSGSLKEDEIVGALAVRFYIATCWFN